MDIVVSTDELHHLRVHHGICQARQIEMNASARWRSAQKIAVDGVDKGDVSCK